MKDTQITVKPAMTKDYFILHIADKLVGQFERSQLRYIIEKIDNAIQMTDTDLNRCTTMELEHILLNFTYFPNKKLQRCKRILDARYNKRKSK